MLWYVKEMQANNLEHFKIPRLALRDCQSVAYVHATRPRLVLTARTHKKISVKAFFRGLRPVCFPFAPLRLKNARLLVSRSHQIDRRLLTNVRKNVFEKFDKTQFSHRILGSRSSEHLLSAFSHTQSTVFAQSVLPYYTFGSYGILH